MDSIKLFILATGNRTIVSFTLSLNCVKLSRSNCFSIVLSCKSSLTDLNMFSIGFRSGLRGGILSNCALTHCKAIFATAEFWLGSLS